MPLSAHRPAPTQDAAAIWREFHDRLLAFIRRRVRDPESAEDILQEVMLRIHRGAGQLEHAPALTAWVHEIARNAIVDHHRRAAVRHERPAGLDVEPEAPAPEPPGPDPRAELASCLAPMLERLPEPQRAALILTELEGLTQEGAAARVGLSTPGMKSRVQRGRAQLRQLLMECCAIELDRRGAVAGYEPRSGSCDCPPAAGPTT